MAIKSVIRWQMVCLEEKRVKNATHFLEGLQVLDAFAGSWGRLAREEAVNKIRAFGQT